VREGAVELIDGFEGFGKFLTYQQRVACQLNEMIVARAPGSVFEIDRIAGIAGFQQQVELAG